MSLPSFALAVLVLLVMPGPTNTLLATAGTERGARRALRLIPFEWAGYLTAINALVAFMVPLRARIPHFEAWVRVVAALVLGALAIKLWLGATHEHRKAVGPVDLYVTTLANPKALVFATFMPDWSAGAATVGAFLLVFSVLCVTAAVGWVCLGGWFSTKRWPSPALVRRAASVTLAGFCALVASSACTALS